MIEIKIVKNEDVNSCSYCGEQHKELIDMSEPLQPGSGFIMSRRCARKFLQQLKQFVELHPSGV